MIEFGSRVKDAFTGHEGLVTARRESISGPAQCLVWCIEDGPDSEDRDGTWIDETRLARLSKPTGEFKAAYRRFILSKEGAPVLRHKDERLLMRHSLPEARSA